MYNTCVQQQDQKLRKQQQTCRCVLSCLTALACVHITYFTCFLEWNLSLDDPW